MIERSRPKHHDTAGSVASCDVNLPSDGDTEAQAVAESVTGGRVSPEQWATLRLVGFAAYALLLLAQLTVGLPGLERGLPLSPFIIMGWLGLASAVWSIGRDRREVFYALIGWGSLAVAIQVYAMTRSVVDNWWGNPASVPGHPRTIPQQSLTNAEWVTKVERVIGFGHDPTTWLQQHLYIRNDEDAAHWEIFTALVYLSHFFVVYVVAIVQWIRNRTEWLRWVLTLSTLLVFGVSLYLLVPLAPPWLASPAGLVGPVDRVGTRALQYIQLDAASKIWEKGAASSNEVAAFPSLHLGFTVLVSAYFWGRAKLWVRVLLVAYPLAMAFALVYSGEHYIVDCIAGALLAIFVVWFTRRITPWITSRQFLNKNSSSSAVNSSASSSASID